MISLPASRQRGDAAVIATNLRRLMARHGLTFVEVVEATGLDERTIRGVVRGANHPHARTLHKLAQGLGVEIDELFRPLASSPSHQFDRATNTFVESVVARHGRLFENWSEANFDELYSRFGAGGQLTESGILTAAETMNAKRDLWRQISVILESGEAKLLAEFVNILFHRATTTRQSQNNE
jgi:transcriptional regulator with XRE-family HTH domain